MVHFRETFAVAILAVLLTAVSVSGQLWDKGGTNVITVAKKGGDFQSIQAALDSIKDASEVSPYLVYVAPGVYRETVRMKDYVTVEGAGEGLTPVGAMRLSRT